MNKIFAIVGMTGSGKTTAANYMGKKGFQKIYFGDITMEIMKAEGKTPNEENERIVREGVRKKYGMAAYAVLNLPKIKDAIKRGHVVIDGLYSTEEYLHLYNHFKDNLSIVCIHTPTKLRRRRLSIRKERALTPEQSLQRDFAEIQNLNKGGPIALADHIIINDDTLQKLHNEVDKVVEEETKLG